VATPTERRSWVCCLLAAVALGALPGLGGAEPEAIEVAVRVLPAKQPALYLRFRNNKLWMATSQTGLEKATPIRAAKVALRPYEEGIESRSYDFPEVSLPLSLRGIEKIRARFYSLRQSGKGNAAPANTPQDRTRVVGAFRISRRDRSGVVWAYTLNSIADSATATAPGRRLELALPQLDPDRLTLDVETQVEERTARIGLQVKSGDMDIHNVLKGDANAPATIEIVDLKGRTVVSKKGDLDTFGFT
jgi:hypothetical protein